jgi:hypothetical protein
MVPVRRGFPLQIHGFPSVGVTLEFPGFPREFTGVWAPNGHPDGCGLGRNRNRGAVVPESRLQERMGLS